MDFEWDAQKVRMNARKHGIQFADAVHVLEDDGALTTTEHASDGEQRWITLGVDALGRILVVVSRGGKVECGSFQPDRPRRVSGIDCRGLMKSEYDFTKAKRGAVVPTPPGKTRVTIRLDNEVLDWFRKQVDDAGGGNYQALINDALLEHIARRREPLESTIRRVIREELRRTG